MEATARRFETVNGELQAMLGALMAELEPLRQRWQGLGAASFERVREAFRADQEALNRALVDTAAAIRASGSAYAATDDRSGRALAHSYRPNPLPL